MSLRRSLRTARWGYVAARLFIQLGCIDRDLLESIDVEAQKSKEARTPHKTLKECEKALWRLRLGRVEPPFDCGICGHQGRGMGLSCARGRRVLSAF